MKKYILISFIYLIISLVFGVFYREFTKAFDLAHTYQTLGLVHAHLLILGVIFVILIGLLNIKLNKENDKLNKYSFIFYLIGLSGANLFLLIRGILNILVEVKYLTLSSGINSMISGLSGLFHVILGVCLILIFISYLRKEKNKTN